MRLWFLWLPVVLWVALIAFFSSMPHIFITDIPYMVPFLNMLGIELQSYDHDAQRQANFLLRKGMHLFVYLVLGLLTLRALVCSGVRRAILIALVFVVLVAIGDEFNQSFNPDRSGKVTDVVIDFVGAVVGVGVYLVLRRFFNRPGAGTQRKH